MLLSTSSTHLQTNALKPRKSVNAIQKLVKTPFAELATPVPGAIVVATGAAVVFVAFEPAADVGTGVAADVGVGVGADVGAGVGLVVLVHTSVVFEQHAAASNSV